MYEVLARNYAQHVFEVRGSRARIATVADAAENLAVPIYLTQFALRIVFILTVDHQVIDNQANTRTNPEGIFGQYWGEHRNPFYVNKIRPVYVSNCIKSS